MSILADAEACLLANGWTRHTPAAPTTGPILIAADGKTAIGLRATLPAHGPGMLHATCYLGERYSLGVYVAADAGVELGNAFLANPAARTPGDLAKLEWEMLAPEEDD